MVEQRPLRSLTNDQQTNKIQTHHTHTRIVTDQMNSDAFKTNSNYEYHELRIL